MRIRKIGLIIKKGVKIPPLIEEALQGCLVASGIQIIKNRDQFKNIEAILVLGGDGTLLRAVPLAYQLDVPLLGINLGHLGFLTEITPEEAFSALKALVKGQYEWEARLLLEVIHNGRSFYVLNEAAIIKGTLGHMIHIKVSIEERELTIYHGDGLIIATPTGSTAYNLSAGGPIVHPQTQAVILTPICPFMLSARPIVLPSHLCLQTELISEGEEVHLILDGYINQKIFPGEPVYFRMAPRALRLVKSPHKDYFEILRAKLGWTEPTIKN